VPVDTTLSKQVYCTIAPKATTATMTFSGGGTGPKVTFKAGGQTLQIGSPLGNLLQAHPVRRHRHLRQRDHRRGPAAAHGDVQSDTCGALLRTLAVSAARSGIQSGAALA
jgi:hypothetical protein